MVDRLLDRFYHLSPPQRTRPSDKPMEVLCLGLSRTDTDSLSLALEILGYNHVYHSSIIASGQREDCAFWVPLMERKYKKGKARLQGIDFDQVLGNFQAVTDGPANVFGEELIDYYPAAKIILNRRLDINPWYSSMQSTSSEAFSWQMWTLSWFNSRLYWLWRNSHLVMHGYFDDDFEQNGKSYAKAHSINIKDYVKDSQREYLEWSVGDGWQASLAIHFQHSLTGYREPLCQYLNKPIPEEKFPSRRQNSLANTTRDLMFPSIRNLSIAVVLLSVLLWFWRHTVLYLLVTAYITAQSSTVRTEVYPDMEMGRVQL